jgi:DNA-binding transcriptional regulator/RsmH inhibitor MraZ
MPQYNIELRTQHRVWETLAIEMETMTDARIEVARFVGELLKDHAREVWTDEDWRVDVTDEAGMILFVMHLFVTNVAAMEPPRR